MTRSPEERLGATGPTFDYVDRQFVAIERMYGNMQMKPDYSAVFDSEDFQTLAPEDQAALRAKYGESAPTEQPAEKEAVETAAGGEREPAVPAATTETRENHERPREGKPKTWLFERYILRRDRESGAWVMQEIRSRYNQRKDRYEKSRDPLPTSIRLPAEWGERLAADQDFRRRVTAYCESIHHRLDAPDDEGGLRILFDPIRGRGRTIEGLAPKWKYALDVPSEEEGKDKREVHEDAIRVGEAAWADNPNVTAESNDVLPPDLFELAKNYFEKRSRSRVEDQDKYWRDSRWRQWFGKTIQLKREGIISAELLRHGLEALPPVPVREEIAQSESPAEQPAELPAKPPTRGKTLADVVAASVDKQEHPAAPAKAVETAPARAAVSAAEPPAREAAPRRGAAPTATERRAETAAPTPAKPTAAERQEAPREVITEKRMLEQAGVLTDNLIRAFAELNKSPQDAANMVEHIASAVPSLLREYYRNQGFPQVAERVSRPAFVGQIREMVLEKLGLGRPAPEESRPAPIKQEQYLERRDQETREQALERALGDLVAESLRDMADKIDQKSAAEVARVLKIALERSDYRTDVVRFAPETGRLVVTDLSKLRQIIKTRYEKLVGK